MLRRCLSCLYALLFLFVFCRAVSVNTAALAVVSDTPSAWQFTASIFSTDIPDVFTIDIVLEALDPSAQVSIAALTTSILLPDGWSVVGAHTPTALTLSYRTAHDRVDLLLDGAGNTPCPLSGIICLDIRTSAPVDQEQKLFFEGTRIYVYNEKNKITAYTLPDGHISMADGDDTAQEMATSPEESMGTQEKETEKDTSDGEETKETADDIHTVPMEGKARYIGCRETVTYHETYAVQFVFALPEGEWPPSPMVTAYLMEGGGAPIRMSVTVDAMAQARSSQLPMELLSLPETEALGQWYILTYDGLSVTQSYTFRVVTGDPDNRYTLVGYTEGRFVGYR